jgi:hypothetical protein
MDPLVSDLDHEGTWKRAWRDALAASNKLLFRVSAVLTAAGATAFTVVVTDAPGLPLWARAILSFLSVFVGPLLIFGVALAVVAAVTPTKQRNEARDERDANYRTVHMPWPASFDEVISGLQEQIDAGEALLAKIEAAGTVKERNALALVLQRWIPMCGPAVTASLFRRRWEQEFFGQHGRLDDGLPDVDTATLRDHVTKRLATLQGFIEEMKS